MNLKILLSLGIFFIFLAFSLQNTFATTMFNASQCTTGFNADAFLNYSGIGEGCIEPLFNAHGELQVNNNSVYIDRRALIKVNLTVLPVNAIVTNATFYMIPDSWNSLDTGTIYGLASLNDENPELCSATYSSIGTDIKETLDTSILSNPNGGIGVDTFLAFTNSQLLNKYVQDRKGQNITLLVYVDSLSNPLYSGIGIPNGSVAVCNIPTTIHWVLEVVYETAVAYSDYTFNITQTSGQLPINAPVTMNMSPLVVPSDCVNPTATIYEWLQFYPNNYATAGSYDYHFGNQINGTWNLHNVGCSLGGGIVETDWQNLTAGYTYYPQINGTLPAECNASDLIDYYTVSANIYFSCQLPLSCESGHFCNGLQPYFQDINCVQTINETACTSYCINDTGCSATPPAVNVNNLLSFETVQDLIPSGMWGIIIFMSIGLVTMGYVTVKIEHENKSGNGWIIGTVAFVGVLIIGNIFSAVPLWITIAIVVVGILYFSRGLWVKTGGT